jgi:hypothetical protein
MADSYVICSPLSSSRVAGIVKEVFLAGYGSFTIFFGASELLLCQKNRSSWILLRYGASRRSHFGNPTTDNELARLRNITLFRMNEMRWALADTETSCSILSVGVGSVVDRALTRLLAQARIGSSSLRGTSAINSMFLEPSIGMGPAGTLLSNRCLSLVSFTTPSPR